LYQGGVFCPMPQDERNIRLHSRNILLAKLALCLYNPWSCCSIQKRVPKLEGLKDPFVWDQEVETQRHSCQCPARPQRPAWGVVVSNGKVVPIILDFRRSSNPTTGSLCHLAIFSRATFEAFQHKFQSDTCNILGYSIVLIFSFDNPCAMCNHAKASNNRLHRRYASENIVLSEK